MKAATVTFFAIALLAAFASAATTTANTTTTTNTTNATATLYCGTANGTSCTTWLGLQACCAVFVGSHKNTTSNVTTSTTSSACMAEKLVPSGTVTLPGTSYTGTYSCLNSGMITQVTAFIVSLGLLSMFA